jgi:hypothetical protein
MKYVDHVRRKCRAHQKRQLGIATNGGPEAVEAFVVVRSKDVNIKLKQFLLT